MLKKQIWVLVLSLVVVGSALFLSPAAMGFVILGLEIDGTSLLVTGELGNAHTQLDSFTDVPEVVTDDEPASFDSSRVLLWATFIISLAIFSAAVVGAILLYDRRH